MAVRNKSGRSVSRIRNPTIFCALEIEKLLGDLKSIELLTDRLAMGYGLMASLSLLLLYCSLLGKLEKWIGVKVQYGSRTGSTASFQILLRTKLQVRYYELRSRMEEKYIYSYNSRVIKGSWAEEN